MDPQEDVVKEVTGAYSMYMMKIINNDVLHFLFFKLIWSILILDNLFSYCTEAV